jgi:CheY-like chemotaxis protein/MinD-like ATPase involved in chromosome partitioning or flagellar assembly
MPQKILIADDDVETLRLIGLMLQRQGFEIAAASNGVQALDMSRNGSPDLIILDVMMPDMDGYQVTRQIRQDASTAEIPILMFTAKSQVEDKVTGYEAGVDEYITKPIHPAELVARVKALLSRAKSRPASPNAERGYMIAVVAPKGGLGASTLALNLAISYAQRVKSEVIAAELRPGHGCWAQDLGYNTKEGLNNLLKTKPFEIRNTNVEAELVRTTFNGVRLLLADSEISDVDLVGASAQLEAVVRTLPFLAPMVLLDIGAPVLPKIDRILAFCDEVMLITEPFPSSLRSTKRYMTELGNCGFGKSKLLSLVMINRIRADVQLTITQVQESLGLTVAQVIPPVPEVAYQAALQYLPIVKIQPDGLIAQQFKRLAEIISQRRK